MKVIIYRNKADNSIKKIEDCQKYLDMGKTMMDIQLALSKFNDEQHSVELHDVAEGEEDIVRLAISDSAMLFVDKIIHSCSEEVPGNVLIYVFRKFQGHETPAMSVMRVHAEGVKLPELRDGDNALPIAWCRAKDLMGLVGMTKSFINKQTDIAKRLAWGWYKE